jgi:hypothetical protein
MANSLGRDYSPASRAPGGGTHFPLSLLSAVGMDYIVTCVDQLGWEALVPFVGSARAHAPRARLVIFATRLPAGTLTRLREAGAEIHCFDALFPDGKARTKMIRTVLWRTGIFAASKLRYRPFCQRWLWRWGGLLLPRNQARFFTYRAWLEDCTTAGDRLLLCDARDLVFQSDPFAHFPAPSSAFVVEEEATVSLSANSYNARWYRESYGARMLDRDGGHPVVCAGLIGGEQAALARTLDAIIAESCRRPRLYGADQAVVNHLHYEGRLGCTKFLNGEELVWHLYGVAPENIVINPDYSISAPGRRPCPIVHMYDRVEKAHRAVNLRWKAS